MPAKKNSSKKSEGDQHAHSQPRPFWSGVIAFGLVSLPVSVFAANRSKPVSLKMVSAEGVPLRRRYFCEKENKALSRDDIVRGYPIDRNHFVVVKDRELASLAPKKSQEIDLSRFVSLAEIDPIYFQRAYFLIPEEGAIKAYRLLAKSMEDERRAGIATFVMRGKEYLVTIIAEGGILRAETLRFADEIRSPDDVGLPQRQPAKKSRVKRLHTSINKLSRDTVDRKMLADRYMLRLQQLIDDKHRRGRDVVQVTEAEFDEEEVESNVIDMMQVLKERLEGEASSKAARNSQSAAEEKSRAPSKSPGNRSQKTKGRQSVDNSSGKNDLKKLNKEDLYQLAVDRHIRGRSSMSKPELIKALR